MHRPSSSDAPTTALARFIDSRVPREVRTIDRALTDAGFRAWIVGGSVRDLMLAFESATSSEERSDHPSPPNNKASSGDWDLCTDATPEQVIPLFRKVIPTGIAHGTVTVVLSQQHFEITTLRGETTYSDGRRPDDVFYVSDLKEDLARRDFTVNAMAFDLATQTLHDPFGGADDLKARRLRAVGAAEERFSEDGLRVLRLARFSATLGFDVEESTRAAIRPTLPVFRKVAMERVRDEWQKALKSAAPSRFLRLSADEGLFEITAPELKVTPRLCEVLDEAPRDPGLRLALLCMSADVSVARALGARLRLSKDEIARLDRLSHYGRPLDETPLAPPKIRRYLHAVERPHADDVLLARRHAAPLFGVSGDETAAFESACRAELSSNAALSMKELAVDGAALMQEAGVPKGPLLGTILRELLNAVLEDPEQNSREALLALAGQRLLSAPE